jgi:hypothetical protein
MRLTIWKARDDFSDPVSLTLTPPELEELFSRHVVIANKEHVKLFGAYSLKDNAQGRRDASVQSVTAMVFDVDTFPKGYTSAQSEEHIARCRKLLADVPQFWYTTHSHNPPNKYSWRLVIPLRKSVQPEHYKDIRLMLLKQYDIPADPATSQAPSQAYYLPSRHPDRASSTWFSYKGLALLEPPTPSPSLTISRPDLKFYSVDFPPEPTEPVDLTPLRERIRARISTLTRAETVSSFKDDTTGKLLLQRQSSQRKEYLQNVLDGKPLAPDGQRRNAMRSVTWELVWILPHGTSVGTIVHILEPSIEAMRHQGSKVDEHETERLVRGAMLKAGAERVQRQKSWESLLDQFCPKDVRKSLEGKS